MKARRSNLRRTTLVSIALALFLVGLGVARLRLGIEVLAVVAAVLFGFVFVVLKPRKTTLGIALLLLVAFTLGVFQGARFMTRVDEYQNIYGKKVTLTVTAREDAIYSERKQLIFSADDIFVNENGTEQELVGNVQIEGFGVPMVYRGDRITVTGKVFPKRGENIAGMSFAEISVIRANDSIVDKIRRNFAVGMQNALPEPLASFGLGLLIGQRNTLPEKVRNELVAVGLIHIVAVSGYNLTIITNFSKRLLAKRSRYQALVGSFVLIGIFLLMTGSSPSIVRAAVVSGISLVMWYYGRNIKPVLMLLLAAALTAGINPLYLWSSIGWYLSFAAFFGVLVIAPGFRNKYMPKKHRDKLLPQVLTETIAAQVATLPIILYIFGRLSLISIVANVLVVPVLPFAMLASLVAGLYGMLGWQVFSLIVTGPARIILGYILEISSLLSRIPSASVGAKINLIQMLVLVALVLVWTVLLWKKSSRVARITDKNEENYGRS